jgi:tRNA threonylcarbamoyladenosine biosynthesis protein TsaE
LKTKTKKLEKSWKNIGLSELGRVAEVLSGLIKTDKKIAFYGELGSGKTTLIKEICFFLGIHKTDISSPSFTILNEYGPDDARIYHFDFYRLKKADELFELGYEEYFFSNNIVLIEWPEKIMELLPEFFSKVELTINTDHTRNIRYIAGKK